MPPSLELLPTDRNPVISMAVEPVKSADQVKLANALARMADEDPTFHVHTHEETGQCLISGMGELHLEVVLEKLRRDYGVETQAGAPQIACRESIRHAAVGDHLLKKQNGGSGMYAGVKLEVTPLPRGEGIRIEEAITGGSIPSQFLGSVRRGVTDALTSGPILGAPVVDLLIRVTDGSYHAKDSNDMAFRQASAAALQEALHSAQPILLEPIMQVECRVDESHQGDILGDLNRRRGRVSDIAAEPGASVIRARVPLVEMFGYAGAIRSLSRGRASYSMSPLAYEEAPTGLVEKLKGG